MQVATVAMQCGKVKREGKVFVMVFLEMHASFLAISR